ncbi:MAG: PHP domain-containing protein [Vicinamibacterales bacterium]
MSGPPAAPLPRTLDELALIAGIRGDAADQSLFTRAAALVRLHGIGSDTDLGPLLQAPPAEADPDVISKLRHMYDAPAWVMLESALADLPIDLRWLFESGAVTVPELATLHRELGVVSAADLAAAVADHAVRDGAGLGESIETAIATALPHLRQTVPRLPLGRASAIADPILALLGATPGVRWALPAGSLRRCQDTVGDIELVAACDDSSAAIDELVRLPNIARRLHRGERRVCLLFERLQVGVRLPEPSAAGLALLHGTGSMGHLTALRTHATSVGWRLTASGLRRPDGSMGPSETEEEIYAALGLPFIPPEIRHGEDEVGAAAAGSLPTLLSRQDIRGDLHMHTSWSDGRDTVEGMVKACCALGYEYMAITDHSPTSAAVRNLSIANVARQADEIARLREQYPRIAILQGCEVDILPDGRLDLPDHVLERLDIVLASLHERVGQSSEQLMGRYLAAMKHPFVNIITHPTNRSVPRNPGYDLDYDRLFATAAETGTLVEIDGAPVHLDLDGALARRAAAVGATIAVNSDSHRADVLERHMDFGVGTARRGWVEPRHVVNTRPLAEIRRFVAAKRSRSG